MRIISRAVLSAFWAQHPDAEQPLKAWYEEASHAQWTSPQDIKDLYRHASFRPNRRVVFNIKGNDYRLVVAVAFRFQAIYIKFVGTHAEYDKINVDTVEPE
jgi:mRNA interferase HigB